MNTETRLTKESLERNPPNRPKKKKTPHNESYVYKNNALYTQETNFESAGYVDFEKK